MSTATEVRERPILFSGPMVRAILDGTKTQTRRVVKRHPLIDAGFSDEFVTMPENRVVEDAPYSVGGRLWVRETWAAWALVGAGDLWRFLYAADNRHRDLAVPDDWRAPRSLDHGERNAPSIFMPRFASRILLEVTDVRIERLHRITDADALAEGVVMVRDGCYVVRGTAQDRAGLGHSAPETAFACAWNEINEARGHGWDTNPWAWVVSFRRIAR